MLRKALFNLAWNVLQYDIIFITTGTMYNFSQYLALVLSILFMVCGYHVHFFPSIVLLFFVFPSMIFMILRYCAPVCSLRPARYFFHGKFHTSMVPQNATVSIIKLVIAYELWISPGALVLYQEKTECFDYEVINDKDYFVRLRLRGGTGCSCHFCGDASFLQQYKDEFHWFSRPFKKAEALVIFNYDYDHCTKLPNVAKGFDSCTKTLDRVGFASWADAKNLTASRMRACFKRFMDHVRATGVEIVLIWCAGHGLLTNSPLCMGTDANVELHKNPSGTKGDKTTLVEDKSLGLSEGMMLAELNQIPSVKHAYFLFDTCLDKYETKKSTSNASSHLSYTTVTATSRFSKKWVFNLQAETRFSVILNQTLDLVQDRPAETLRNVFSIMAGKLGSAGGIVDRYDNGHILAHGDSFGGIHFMKGKRCLPPVEDVSAGTLVELVGDLGRTPGWNPVEILSFRLHLDANQMRILLDRALSQNLVELNASGKLVRLRSRMRPPSFAPYQPSGTSKKRPIEDCSNSLPRKRLV